MTSITIPDSVTSIEGYAFYDCRKLGKVYFRGSAEQWDTIRIYDNSTNNCLKNAERYYYSEMKPTKYGNYWHYDEKGNIKEW